MSLYLLVRQVVNVDSQPQLCATALYFQKKYAKTHMHRSKHCLELGTTAAKDEERYFSE